MDISVESDFKKKISKILKEFVKIHGLINNAANNPKIENSDQSFSRLENFDLNMWNNDLNVGLRGSFLCIKYFGRVISQNTEGGSIINISSDLGIIAPDQRIYKNIGFIKPVTYSVVKHGVIGFSKYLATYLAEYNIRSNTLCPGGISNNQPKKFLNKIRKLIPLNRMAKINDYDGIILYLCSDYSSYMTGSTIVCDGGRTSW